MPPVPPGAGGIVVSGGASSYLWFSRVRTPPWRDVVGVWHPGHSPAPAALDTLDRMTDALTHFSSRLAFETDPSDVYAAQRAGETLVIVDVRGIEAWQQGRVPGAVHMPYADIPTRAPDEILLDATVVVYCWSPGCNAAQKAGLAFARLGYTVREMIGGYEYWVREGYPHENDDGPLPRVFDPLVMVVRPAATTSS